MDNYNPNWVWYGCGVIEALAVAGFCLLHAKMTARETARAVKDKGASMVRLSSVRTDRCKHCSEGGVAPIILVLSQPTSSWWHSASRGVVQQHARPGVAHHLCAPAPACRGDSSGSGMWAHVGFSA
jgi:hypothetical protein